MALLSLLLLEQCQRKPNKTENFIKTHSLRTVVQVSLKRKKSFIIQTTRKNSNNEKYNQLMPTQMMESTELPGKILK